MRPMSRGLRFWNCCRKHDFAARKCCASCLWACWSNNSFGAGSPPNLGGKSDGLVLPGRWRTFSFTESGGPGTADWLEVSHVGCDTRRVSGVPHARPTLMECPPRGRGKLNEGLRMGAMPASRYSNHGANISRLPVLPNSASKSLIPNQSSPVLQGMQDWGGLSDFPPSIISLIPNPTTIVTTAPNVANKKPLRKSPLTHVCTASVMYLTSQ